MEEIIIDGYLTNVSTYQNEQYATFPNHWYNKLAELYKQFPNVNNVVQLPKEYYLYIKDNKIGNLKIFHFYEEYSWIYEVYALRNEDMTVNIGEETYNGELRNDTSLTLKDKDYKIENGDYVKLVYEENTPIDELGKTCIVRFDENNACMVNYKNGEFSLEKLGGN